MCAREAVSARLDAELSELDLLRLDAHLRGCAACREFADHAATLTVELRRAPLEQPLVQTFAPRRRRVQVRMHAAAAAAVVVLVAGSVVLGRVAVEPTPNQGSSTSSAADIAQARQDDVVQRVLAKLPPSDRWSAEQRGPIRPL